MGGEQACAAPDTDRIAINANVRENCSGYLRPLVRESYCMRIPCIRDLRSGMVATTCESPRDCSQARITSAGPMSSGDNTDATAECLTDEGDQSRFRHRDLSSATGMRFVFFAATCPPCFRSVLLRSLCSGQSRARSVEVSAAMGVADKDSRWQHLETVEQKPILFSPSHMTSTARPPGGGSPPSPLP